MKKLLLATTIIIAGFALSSAAMAQTDNGAPPSDIPGHPRVNEVDQRDQNQQNRIDQGVTSGELTKHEAAHEEARLHHEENVQQKQEAEHGGHLTKAEQRHDNKMLNHGSNDIYRQKHDRQHRHHHGEHRHHRH